ncbi:MAG: DUF1028 domain-containing protein [Anaerolineae bacterium]|nr:DUF1028 domain-containing protein [Anaerolineae bacterium]
MCGNHPATPVVATFSIVALDPANGDLGVAVASKFLAVGAVVPWAKAGVGAVATQALANLAYGPDGLRLMAQELSAEETLTRLLRDDPEREHRQVGLVDARGRAAAHTGQECFPWAGHHVGEGFCCQGNILTGPEVVQEMARAFQTTQGELAERLLAALLAGDEAGGDRRGRQSAALLVVREGGSYGGTLDRYIDLRVDDHPTPVQELARLLDLHRLYLQKPRPEDLMPLEGETCQELQRILAALGYYKGPVHGQYDEATREALADCAGIENLEERLLEEPLIDRVVLEFLREKAFPQGRGASG